MIQPRKPVDSDPLPVLSVCHLEDECLLDGELFPLADLPVRLVERPPGGNDWEQIPAAIVATDDPGALVANLDRRFSRQGARNFMLWQWSLSLRPATVWLGGETTSYEALTPHVSWFGWAARRGTFHRRGGARRYIVLDALNWTDSDKILDGYPGRLVQQMGRFAADIQRFCREQRMRPRLTAASIASQLLRDRRFWPSRDRRKVPRATNDRVREQLPGNHYRLLALTRAGRPAKVAGTVLELDQINAHHAAAGLQGFPASDSLYAWGRFYAPVEKLRIVDLVADISELEGEHGLLLALVKGAGNGDPLVPPAVTHAGLKWRHVWTNELPLIAECGGQVAGIAAGWTSNVIDEGLNAYAWEAIQQLANSPPARRGWLKQALLATYGLLAAKPRGFTQLNKWGEGEQMAVTTRTGHTLHGRLRRTAETESETCNVIWRGLIESRVRAETISYARQLRDAGRRILSL